VKQELVVDYSEAIVPFIVSSIIVSTVGWFLFVPFLIFFGLIVVDELIVLAGYFLFKRRLSACDSNELSNVRLGRYAFLLVAHNEEVVLPDLLQSIANLDYPTDKYSVFVLADNCTDATADLARQSGATVFERREGGGLGKGFAVQYLINCLADVREEFDATITLDSDAKLNRDYLTEMNRIHQAGYPVVMGRPETPKEKASLSWINSFGLRCVAISETARFAMGFAARFSSNTTLVHRDIWKSFDWKCLKHLNTAEEMCGWFIEKGIPIGYAGNAIVVEEAPRELENFAGQRSRWYITYCRQFWYYVPRLLWSAIRNLDWWRFEAMVGNFFVIGHTVELLYGMLLISISLLTGNLTAISIAVGLMLLKMFHVSVLCVLTGVGIGDLVSLAVRMPYHAFSWILAIIKSLQLSKTWVHAKKYGPESEKE
jgi:cellulose synthase/poly-beta-1,6-N-acetylglucosamine synthase-like glycosyltransferase